METKYVNMTMQHPTSNAKPSFRASIRLMFLTMVLLSPIFRVSLKPQVSAEEIDIRSLDQRAAVWNSQQATLFFYLEKKL